MTIWSYTRYRRMRHGRKPQKLLEEDEVYLGAKLDRRETKRMYDLMRERWRKTTRHHATALL